MFFFSVMHSFSHFRMFFGGSMSWTLAIGQLMNRERKFFNFMFAVFLFSMGACQYYSVLVVTDTLTVYHYLGFLHLPFLCLTGPAFYLCFKSVFWKDFQLSKKHFLHAIPVIITVLLIIPLVTAEHNAKLEVLRYPPSFRSGNPARTYYSFVITLILITGMSYLVAFFKECSFLLSIKYIRKNGVPVILITVVALLCISGVIYTSAVVLNNFAADSRILYHILVEVLSMILLFTVFIIYWMSSGRDNYFQALRNHEEKRRYEKSRIGNLDMSSIIPRLEYLMKEDKLYRSDEISLIKLAGHLGIESYQLSQMINEKFNKNFSTFINEYRIEEAKMLLLQERERTIFSIAYAVGFNSPAPFYEWFQKLTGLSPSKYRKKNLIR